MVPVCDRGRNKMCFVTDQAFGIFMVTFGFLNHKITLYFCSSCNTATSITFQVLQLLKYRSCSTTVSHNIIQPESISTLALIRNMSSDKNEAMILLIKNCFIGLLTTEKYSFWGTDCKSWMVVWWKGSLHILFFILYPSCNVSQ